MKSKSIVISFIAAMMLLINGVSGMEKTGMEKNKGWPWLFQLEPGKTIEIDCVEGKCTCNGEKWIEFSSANWAPKHAPLISIEEVNKIIKENNEASTLRFVFEAPFKNVPLKTINFSPLKELKTLAINSGSAEDSAQVLQVLKQINCKGIECVRLSRCHHNFLQIISTGLFKNIKELRLSVIGCDSNILKKHLETIFQNNQQLEKLMISECNISLDKIDSLKTLRNLKDLTVINTPISENLVKELQQNNTFDKLDISSGGIKIKCDANGSFFMKSFI